MCVIGRLHVMLGLDLWISRSASNAKSPGVIRVPVTPSRITVTQQISKGCWIIKEWFCLLAQAEKDNYHMVSLICGT